MRGRGLCRGFIVVLIIGSSGSWFGCGSATAPTPPAVTATSVTVSVAGSASPTLAPGETRQLSAAALQTNGTTVDVTTLATWQSSSPAIATVSPAGLLTGVAEGSVDVTARYVSASGTLRAEVRPICAVSITPGSAAYNAFGGTATVTVTVDSGSCRWSARSDASWFRFAFDAANPGSGSFAYALPPNSTPFPRSATLIVETATGQRAVHAITEDKPAACSYVAQPDEITFTASGGTGQFTVVTTPNDCQWNLVNGMAALGVSITSGFSGVGTRLVRYSVQAHTRAVDADGYLEIAGLSGLNPNGRHHIVIQKR